jgi:hypothetical protein
MAEALTDAQAPLARVPLIRTDSSHEPCEGRRSRTRVNGPARVRWLLMPCTLADRKSHSRLNEKCFLVQVANLFHSLGHLLGSSSSLKSVPLVGVAWKS